MAMRTAMNAQTKTAVKILRRIKRHLLKQGRKSKDLKQDGSCAYRTTDGLTCAIGCLIPKTVYDPRAEGSGIDAVTTGHGRWTGVGEGGRSWPRC